MTVNLFDPKEFGFPEGSEIFNYLPDARKAINQASLRVRGQSAYSRFWLRALTAAERIKLGDDMELSWGRQPCSINLLCKLREWTAERAIVEIAHKIGFMDVAEYEWLLEVIGDSSATGSVSKSIPTWNRKNGRLELEGTLCRKVLVAKATTIVPVLDAFEDAGWPPAIEYPNESVDPQQIHQSVISLNTNLTGLRFNAQGDQVCWQLASA